MEKNLFTNVYWRGTAFIRSNYNKIVEEFVQSGIRRNLCKELVTGYLKLPIETFPSFFYVSLRHSQFLFSVFPISGFKILVNQIFPQVFPKCSRFSPNVLSCLTACPTLRDQSHYLSPFHLQSFGIIIVLSTNSLTEITLGK